MGGKKRGKKQANTGEENPIEVQPNVPGDNTNAGRVVTKEHENLISDVSDESGSDEKDRMKEEDKKDSEDVKPNLRGVEDDAQQSDQDESGSDEKDCMKEEDKEDSVNPNHAQQSDTNALNNPIKTYILVLVVLAVAVAITLFFAPNNEATIINVQSALDQLFQDFDSQPPRSAKKLRNRVVPYINRTRSPQPFVLLVAAMQKDQLAADCFAERVGKVISLKPLKINGSSYSNVTGDQVKLDIDKSLRLFFQKGKFPTAAIIYNLNLLPYSTLNLFYAYCDHDNPIFKEVTIVFTVMLPPEYHSTLANSDEIKKEGIVETFLQEKWSKDENFDENMIGALLSRISDTVIVLRAESEESLEKSCSPI